MHSVLTLGTFGMFTNNGMVGVPFITLIALLLRWCVSLHHYSGEGQPPMFGDYEAQRHWMEVTKNLPLKDWYYNTTDNDLMYWGLDYPPLTAYHSLLCGYVANIINPKFIALYSSRGFENYEHKLFMRLTVLVADLLIYIPAVWWFFSMSFFHQNDTDSIDSEGSQKHIVEGSREVPVKLMFITLIYPGLILIDHGHFQYNGVSLGLTVAAVAAILGGRDLTASVLFTLALNYKQMELYHALPFFCYLFGNCLPKQNKPLSACLFKFVLLGLVVSVTFLIIWFPFLKDINLTMQVLHRLFPLARGVFEDKVSNIWCCLNVLYKFKDTFTNIQMARVCLFATVMAVLPSSIDMIFYPKLNKFVISLINSSLAFFIFSFQVHEKSILLAAIPVSLYFHHDPLPCFWFLLVSTFSMLPLIIKDGLLIAYFALTCFYCLAVFAIVSHYFNAFGLGMSQGFCTLKIGIHSKTKKSIKKATEVQTVKLIKKVINGTFLMSCTGCILLSVCSVIFKPPARYPDLYPLLISMYSCVHFIGFFVYFNYKQTVILNCYVKPKIK